MNPRRPRSDEDPRGKKKDARPRADKAGSSRDARRPAEKGPAGKKLWPKFGQERAPKFDKPKFDKPKFDKPKFDKPKFDKPKFDKSDRDRAPKDSRARVDKTAPFQGTRPKFDKPKFDKPKVDKPKFDKDRAPKFDNHRAPKFDPKVDRDRAPRSAAGRPSKFDHKRQLQQETRKPNGKRALSIDARRSEKVPPPPPLVMSLDPLPEPGGWVFACRQGYEGDLADELSFMKAEIGVRVLAPGLVSTRSSPPRPTGTLELTFARQGFKLLRSVRAGSFESLVGECARALSAAVPADVAFAVQAFVPDADDSNRLSATAAALGERVAAELDRLRPQGGRRESGEDLRHSGGTLLQLCMAAADVVLVGAVPIAEALSRAPGGRSRMHFPSDSPSRAAMKLEEALEWLGYGPEADELCVDLGAAPGGWTSVLLRRRARVLAVDTGKLRPEIAKDRNVEQVTQSAFTFVPPEPCAWLFCDMAWRPLEVAALLAKWGRNRWARALVCNIKLPMKQKVAMLRRIREILETGGWRDMKTRHLYHDRDEITLTAWHG